MKYIEIKIDKNNSMKIDTYDNSIEFNRFGENITLQFEQIAKLIFDDSQIEKKIAMTKIDEPATIKQKIALHNITKEDTRNWDITKSEASELIKKASQGENINPEIKKFLKGDE